jgi:hypothetical protein
MTTFDYSADPERAAAALTGAATPFSDRSDPPPERLQGEASGSYGRALAALIIAVADLASGPNPPPPRRVGSDCPLAEVERRAERTWLVGQGEEASGDSVA